MTLTVASEAFLEGYRLARLQEDVLDAEGLVGEIRGLGSARIPFAFEGVGMALQARDRGLGEERRMPAMFEVTSGEWHIFLKLGIGCALARLGAPLPDDAAELDGYGFQLGLFGGGRAYPAQDRGARYARGLGRATWFSTGGDGPASAAVLSRSDEPAERWRGVGTACAFAGDPKGHARALIKLAGPHALEVRTGATEALRIWSSLTVVAPARVVSVVDTLRAGTP